MRTHATDPEGRTLAAWLAYGQATVDAHARRTGYSRRYLLRRAGARALAFAGVVGLTGAGAVVFAWGLSVVAIMLAS